MPDLEQNNHNETISKRRKDQYFRLLQEHYIFVAEIDLNNDSFETWYRSERATEGAVADEGTFSTTYHEYLNTLPEGTFSDEVAALGNVDRLRELMKEHDRYSFSYRSDRVPGLWVSVVAYGSEYVDGECTRIVGTYSYVDLNKPPVENIQSADDSVFVAPSNFLQESQISSFAENTFGMRNRIDFYNTVDTKRHSIAPGQYCLISIDIEHFKLFNKWYGRQEGNRFLKKIADNLIQFEALEDNVVTAYFGGDNYAVFMPYDLVSIASLQQKIRDVAIQTGNTVGFLPAFGIYVIGDPTMRAVNMYDGASMALSRVLGNYEMRSYTFSEKMFDEMEAEVRLISEIKRAINEDQFTFYVQPQYNMLEGKIVGGEALVRWIHPKKGLVAPGLFIPVLEKNGLVSEVDRFVWEEVCRWMRGYIDTGHEPIPISVNVSRLDVLSMDVAEVLINLTERYSLDHKLIKVEITESAYAENTNTIHDAVNRLHEEGFQVLMDDFGSGYSSLNMLRTLSFDVIKIDMNFLDIATDTHSKGSNILESVVNMTNTLGLPVVVEGVENRNQEDYLVGMGCTYAQGYYYSKPLSVRDFELLIEDRHMISEEGIVSKQIEQVHINEFGDPNLFNDATLNNILGPTAFYDVCGTDVTITKMNNQYHELLQINGPAEEYYRQNFWNHVPEDEKKDVSKQFSLAYYNPTAGSTRSGGIVLPDGTKIKARTRIFFLKEQNGHKLYVGQIQREENNYFKEEHGSVVDEIVGDFDLLEDYYGHFPGAIVICKLIMNPNGTPKDYEIVYVNSAAKRMTNNDIGRMKTISQHALDEDKGLFLNRAYRAAYEDAVVEHDAYTSTSGRQVSLQLFPYRFGYFTVLMTDETNKWLNKMIMPFILEEYLYIYYINIKENYVRSIHPNLNDEYERSDYHEMLRRGIDFFLADTTQVMAVKEFFDIEKMKIGFQSTDERQLVITDKMGNKIQLTVRALDEGAGETESAMLYMKRL